jgi:Na+:H+ antiporter, NhaA family
MNQQQRDGLLLAGSAVLQKPIELWINDFLMAIFFLAVGIEIKHEWLHGALSTPQARVLPFGAAIGGMAVPALIFTAINWNQPARRQQPQRGH